MKMNTSHTIYYPFSPLCLMKCMLVSSLNNVFLRVLHEIFLRPLIFNSLFLHLHSTIINVTLLFTVRNAKVKNFQDIAIEEQIVLVLVLSACLHEAPWFLFCTTGSSTRRIQTMLPAGRNWMKPNGPQQPF